MKDDDYEMKDFTYYSRIVMMVVNAIELILFIVFIVVMYGVKSDMNKFNEDIERFRTGSTFDIDFAFSEQKQGMEACAAFFIIAFIVFFVEFIFHFGCEKHRYKYEWAEKFFRDWNHLIIILTFSIGQFLYFIACLIIPIYLHRVRTLKDLFEGKLEDDEIDLIDSSIARYVACLIISYVLLVIFVFLYFIILNLYKGLCCDMIGICRNTNRCMDSFFNCFIDNVNFIFQGCKRKSQDINDLIQDIDKEKKNIAEITCNIQNAMKKNIELRVKNIDLL